MQLLVRFRTLRPGDAQVPGHSKPAQLFLPYWAELRGFGGRQMPGATGFSGCGAALAAQLERQFGESSRRCAAPMPITATLDRRTSRWRRPHHLRHRRQDRLAGLGFGDQATRQLGQVIAVGSRVAAQQRECIGHRHL